MPICKTCKSDKAAGQCRGCSSVQYCNAECQAADWPEHQPVCAELRLGRLRFSLGLTPGDEERYARVSSRVTGLALGHGCGDTLGARVLGLPREYWNPRGDELQQLVTGNADVARGESALVYPDIELGQLTDATETWIATARGLLSDRSKPRRSVGEWMRQLASSKPARVTLDTGRKDGSGPLLRASVYAIWSWRDSGTRSLRDLVRDDVSMTTTSPGAADAAVAYAIICRGLLVYEGTARATQSLDDAEAYLRASAPDSAALKAVESLRLNARLNRFDPDPMLSAQAVSPGEPETYHKSLGAVAYFLQTATTRPDGDALWAEAVGNMLAADGQANITAALVGEALAGYYGQQVLPEAVVGALVAQDAGQRPDWLRGQRLLYLSETLGREAS